MKATICTLAIVMIASFADAQEKEGIDLEQLSTPTAPAATIIGIQPNEVIKPKSWKEVEAALINNYAGEGGTSVAIPNDLMIEVMPYWLGNRKNEDVVRTYVDPKNGFWRNLSLSVSSTQKFRLSDSVNTNALGFGFRTSLKRAQVSENQKKLLAGLVVRDQLARIQLTIGSEIDKMDDAGVRTNETFIDGLIANYQKTAEYKALVSPNKILVDSIITALKGKLAGTFTDKLTIENAVDAAFDKPVKAGHEKAKEHYQKYTVQKEGLEVEWAGAVGLNFPTNETDFSVVPKAGTWITATFNPSQQIENEFLKHTTLVFMLRGIRNNVGYYQKYFPDSAGYYRDNLDFGGRVIYEKKKFSVGVELLGRYKLTVVDRIKNDDGTVSTTRKDDWDYKYVANFSYAISRNTVINYTFGKQLEPALTINGTVVSTLGVNFGFGGAKVE